MTTFHAHTPSRPRPPRRWRPEDEPKPEQPAGEADEFCRRALASLPRRDQREKGLAYVRGLLRARGRKSVRNITGPEADQAAMQSLHHFINSSTWQWDPVRRALAAHLDQLFPPRLWAARTMVTPRSGLHTVGVAQYAAGPQHGGVTAQKAVGIWAVSEETAAPVHWRLRLGEEWLADAERRRRAAIPQSVVEESPEEHLLSACRKVAGWGLPLRPFLVDARDLDAHGLLRAFQQAALPLLAQIPGDRLLVPAPRDGMRTAPLCTARQALLGTRRRQPVAATPLGEPRLAAGTRVVAQGPQGAPRSALLVGEWRPGAGEPQRFWLTNLAQTPPAVLLRTILLADGVGRAEELAHAVGVGGYEGRSFRGWHRHVTLASAAHAVLALERSEERDFARAG